MIKFKGLVRLSLALKVQFLQNLFLVCDYFVVDIDCVEVAHHVEVICLVGTTNSATSQLAAAQRFYRCGRSARVVSAGCPAFLASLAARKLRSLDAPPTVIRHVEGSSLRDVDRFIGGIEYAALIFDIVWVQCDALVGLDASCNDS